jgi:hypothetical protein
MFALRIFSGLAAIAAFFVQAGAPRAGEPSTVSSYFAALGIPQGRVEFSNGFDATGNSWTTHGSAVLAPFGPMHADGWRLKMSGHYGTYAYMTRDTTICQKIHDVGHTDPNPTLDRICDSLMDDEPAADREDTDAFLASYGLEIEGKSLVANIPHQATHYQGSIAPGYQHTFGPLIVKAYLGLAYEQHDVLPEDKTNALAGAHWGAQGSVETWLPLSANSWLSADGSIFSGTSSYSATTKLGYRLLDWLTLGPELATYGLEEDVSGRAGAFMRINRDGIETTLSAGMSGSYREEPTLYGAANVFVRF